MLTRAQINAASPVLDETTVQFWASLVRNSLKYNPAYHPDLNTAISNLDGTIQAQMLNALLVLIEDIGAGVVELSGGDDGIRYSQAKERNALIDFGISIIFEKALVGVITTPTTASGGGNYKSDRARLVCALCRLNHYSGWCINNGA